MAKKPAGRATPAAATDAIPLDGLASADGDDAEIIRMVGEIMALHDEVNALAREIESLDWTVRERAHQERIAPLVDRDWELRAAIVPMRATTLAGFRAKARIVQEYCNCSPGYTTGHEDDAVAWSLANDLLGVPSVMKADDDEKAAACL